MKQSNALLPLMSGTRSSRSSSQASGGNSEGGFNVDSELRGAEDVGADGKLEGRFFGIDGDEDGSTVCDVNAVGVCTLALEDAGWTILGAETVDVFALDLGRMNPINPICFFFPELQYFSPSAIHLAFM